MSIQIILTLCMYPCPLSLANTAEMQWKVTGAVTESGSHMKHNDCIVRLMPFGWHLLLCCQDLWLLSITINLKISLVTPPAFWDYRLLLGWAGQWLRGAPVCNGCYPSQVHPTIVSLQETSNRHKAFCLRDLYVISAGINMTADFFTLC